MERNFGPMQEKGRKGEHEREGELMVVTAEVYSCRLGEQSGTTPFVNTSASIGTYTRNRA